jgi:hypothetical protein
MMTAARGMSQREIRTADEELWENSMLFIIWGYTMICKKWDCLPWIITTEHTKSTEILF